MKKILRLSFLFIIFPLAGCFVTYPKNATDFRNTIPDTMNGEKSSFIVKRPYSKVAATFKKYARKCLSVDMSEIIYYNNNSSTIIQRYTPTLKVGKKKLELHIQKKPKSVTKSKKYPEKGYYFIVADADRVGTSKTRVDMYGPSMGGEAMKNAIRAWAKGSRSGCPDLTQ